MFPNPGFEQFLTCPDNISQTNRCLDWSGWSRGTPDYYNCGYYRQDAGIPASGTGVVSFITSTRHYRNVGTYVEGITAKLSQPLRAGHSYQLRFSALLASQHILQNFTRPHGEVALGFYFYNRNLPPVWHDTGAYVACNSFIPQFAIPASAIDTYDKYKVFTFCFRPDNNYDSVYIGGVCTATSETDPPNGYNFNIDDLSLVEQPDTPLNIVTASNELCAGSCLIISLSDTVGISSISYEAPGATAQLPASFPFRLCYASEGTFLISIGVKRDGYCNSFAWKNTVTVTKQPNVQLRDSVLCPGQSLTVNFRAITNSIVSWEDKDTSHVRTFYNTGLHSIDVETGGCKSQASFTLTVLDYCTGDIMVPTAFTPNGDGRNDVFRVISNYPLHNYAIRIYNRWGQCLFYDTDYLHSWDGGYSDAGSYFYYIKYEHPQTKETISLKGDVTLIR